MDIPYGFDCYAFQREEIKYYERDIFNVRKSILSLKDHSSKKNRQSRNATKIISGRENNINNDLGFQTTDGYMDYIKFTRKNEEYPSEQIMALGTANRLNFSEIDRRIFCGIKIQLGIGVVTSFLRKGLQYKAPVRGRSELVNGSWTGIMKGLTVDKNSSLSYDLAFGNFLAWDEEFPYIKFGPFFAIESKLVMLTGSSRRIEASSFGTNVTREIWITILSLLVVLSILASLRIHWQTTKHRDLQTALDQIRQKTRAHQSSSIQDELQEATTIHAVDGDDNLSVMQMINNFIFIYITMLLNKPSLEFDELIWPRSQTQPAILQPRSHFKRLRRSLNLIHPLNSLVFTTTSITEHREYARKSTTSGSLQIGEKIPRQISHSDDSKLKSHYHSVIEWKKRRGKNRCKLPTSIRVISYMWSAACLVIASIYSGEMLAVMLLHADVNIDTISQLISAKPAIEPVIRQDDFTYNLMLKSLDENMLKLYNKTRIIPRQEVYTREFIDNVSQRKLALLGDDELIETIYDLYHKYYPLHKSKVSYLQYPISIIYRKDLNGTLELQLRRGLVQMFEMGLVHRWYQAQKDTYIQFYDSFDRNKQAKVDKKSSTVDSPDESVENNLEQKYKPLSMSQFKSFFRAMFYCIMFAFVVLLMEIIHYQIMSIK